MHAYGCIGLLVDEWDESINQSIVRYYCINTVLVLVLYQFSSVQFSLQELPPNLPICIECMLQADPPPSFYLLLANSGHSLHCLHPR